MECFKYVESYLAFTYLPTFPHLTMQRSNRNPSRPLQRLQIRQGQSTLLKYEKATRMGIIQLPIIDWMSLPPLLASYARRTWRAAISLFSSCGVPVLRTPY